VFDGIGKGGVLGRGQGNAAHGVLLPGG
jgi:hypothetical protein